MAVSVVFFPFFSFLSLSLRLPLPVPFRLEHEVMRAARRLLSTAKLSSKRGDAHAQSLAALLQRGARPLYPRMKDGHISALSEVAEAAASAEQGQRTAERHTVVGEGRNRGREIGSRRWTQGAAGRSAAAN